MIKEMSEKEIFFQAVSEDLNKSMEKRMNLVKGKMQAKLVSLRKLVLFWDASHLNTNHYVHESLDGSNYVIRMYDVSKIDFNGCNAHHFYEFSIPYSQGYWFVKGLLSNRSYIAEIGVKFGKNKFLPLLRSNAVQTPKLEITAHPAVSQDVIKLHQYEDKTPKWTEHISTYSYYIRAENN